MRNFNHYYAAGSHSGSHLLKEGERLPDVFKDMEQSYYVEMTLGGTRQI